MLQIHNTLTGRKEPFRPLHPPRVGMYVCGVTVYDYCHLGHARFLVVFDVVARYLRACGYALTYVRNITDIDDKIINRARENDEPIEALTERFIRAMHEDCEALGVLPPDREPRATEHIAQMIELIECLMERGVAYQVPGGDVYFAVRRFPDYGKLSGNRIEALQAGARIEVDEAKSAAEDFVLWKAAKPGEPAWPSPWGPGRPGWHIECSAMSMHALGRHFDIHGGGRDLVFPHHECEIAQSEACTGEPLATCWMHNGFVRIEEEKMSKSLGNFLTIRELLAEWPGEVLRYYLLTAHYRSPLNFTRDRLEEARQALTRLYTALRGLSPAAEAGGGVPFGREEGSGSDPGARGRFQAAMDDDFNTPEALAVLFELARELNRAREGGDEARARALAGELRQLGGVLGLLEHDPEAFLRGGESGEAAEIEALVAERAEARRRRDFARADAIRDALRARGIVLEDTGGETTWRRVG